MHTIADHIAESGLEGDEAIIKAVQAARCIKGLDYACSSTLQQPTAEPSIAPQPNQLTPTDQQW